MTNKIGDVGLGTVALDNGGSDEWNWLNCQRQFTDVNS